MVTLEIRKEDEAIAKEIYAKCKDTTSYKEISGFDGTMLIQIVIPLAAVLSPLLIKYLENNKVTVKFDGIEISANKRDVPKILKTIQEQRNKSESI